MFIVTIYFITLHYLAGSFCSIILNRFITIYLLISKYIAIKYESMLNYEIATRLMVQIVENHSDAKGLCTK